MKSEIRLLAAMLTEGDTLRTVCPFCNGGSSGEASLSITKDADGVVYKCFRAKCGATGGGRSKTDPKNHYRHELDAKARLREKQMAAEAVWEESSLLDEDQKAWLESKYEFDVDEIVGPLRWNPYKERVLFPIFHSGKMVGFVARSFEGAQPKAVTYQLVPEEPMVALYGPRMSGLPMIVVEDILSAGAMASLGMVSAALLGTATTKEGWAVLADAASKRTRGSVIFALDKDAASIGIGYIKSKQAYFRETNAYLLDKDIKDKSVMEREYIIAEIRGEV